MDGEVGGTYLSVMVAGSAVKSMLATTPPQPGNSLLSGWVGGWVGGWADVEREGCRHLLLPHSVLYRIRTRRDSACFSPHPHHHPRRWWCCGRRGRASGVGKRVGGRWTSRWIGGKVGGCWCCWWVGGRRRLLLR